MEMTNKTFENLKKSLEKGPLQKLDPLERAIFFSRLDLFLPDAERPLKKLYGHLPEYSHWLEKLVKNVAKRYAERSPDLRLLDLQRMAQPDWFQTSAMAGYVCYVDRFAGTLNGVAEKIDYLKDLGINYLHLMPILKPRPQNSDGGFAVVDYRQVKSELGTMKDLADLASVLRNEGISLCIDLVCNHTAKEHIWAKKAARGEKKYQDYYFMFSDRTLPDQYERTVREIFPEFKSGSFTYFQDLDKWVWTTFNEFQWDLNYANPSVLAEMLDIMLFLANKGIEILRLDAVAFLWKRMGTDCENQPEGHYILQAFRALSRIAAPGLILKAEAIVPPPQLVPYLGRGEATNKECEVAYHNVFMVMLWSSLAERKVTLMTHALQQMPTIPLGTSWLTYVRCHDDIGWAVTEEDAAAVALNGYAHRSFLSDFYSGRFPGTFARGATFQFNPKNNDRRISGTCASLAGLEIGLENEDEVEIALAIGRISLIHSMITAFGGIPLLYMGDELGLLNDYDFDRDPNAATDNRWLHRPHMDWSQAERRHDSSTWVGKIFKNIQHLLKIRKRTLQLHAQANTKAVWTHNDHVFGLLRESPRGRVLVLGNFSEWGQAVSRGRLNDLGFGGNLQDLVSGLRLDGWSDIYLQPYQSIWLQGVQPGW